MNNEITVKLLCSVEEICNLLKDKQFTIIDKYDLDDTYYIPKQLQLKNMSNREILSKAIILRKITNLKSKQEIIKITFKKKQIDENGDILQQSKIECEVCNLEDAKRLIEAIGYKELMQIKEHDIVYEKGKMKIAIKDIENGDNLIEVETQNNIEIDTIEKIKQEVNKLKLPIDNNNYFVKKAEIELKKIL